MASLKHFVLRTEAKKLYRDVLRSIKGLDASTAAGVREAAREQFSDHAAETDIDRERVPRFFRQRSAALTHAAPRRSSHARHATPCRTGRNTHAARGRPPLARPDAGGARRREPQCAAAEVTAARFLVF